MRTIFFGSGTFALPALERLGASDLVDVSLVVTAPARPVGRKGELRETPVAEAARKLDMAARAPTSLRDPETVAGLRAERPGLVVLADYGRIIPADVLEMAPHGALNLHPSLLPRHRGASPVPAAILAGDDITGVTLMRMDEGLDTGPIIAQVELPLDGTESSPALEPRLAEMGAELLLASLPEWLAGSLPARPQSDRGVSMTRPLRRSDGNLDASQSAARLERQVRAYQPWPGSFLQNNGERLIVWAAEAHPGEVDDRVGSLVPMGDGLALVSASGRLALHEVQPAGKRRMSGADYRRGKRL